MVERCLGLVAALAARLPTSWLLAFGRTLGLVAWALGIRRRVALENLARAFPHEDERWRRRTLRAFWQQLGMTAVEFLRAPALSPEAFARLVEVEGAHRLEAALADGGGAIVVLAHFGNFELLGSFFARRGLPFTAVTKRLPPNAFNRFWLEQRRRAGMRELPDSGAIRAILQVLRRSEALAMMIDQNMIPRRAIFVPFFGILAATTPAPAILAERTGAPVFLALMHRLPGGRHRAVIEGPLPFARTGDRDRDVEAFTSLLNGELERRIRAAPEQWYWIHRRWKTRPPEAAAPPSTSHADDASRSSDAA